MSEFKPTPGEWYVYRPSGACQTFGISSNTGYAVVWFGSDLDEGIRHEDDAILIADAGNTYHATGMTPSQLAERVKVLEEAFYEFLQCVEQFADFRNGVTDPTGCIDEGTLVASGYIYEAYKLIGKTI